MDFDMYNINYFDNINEKSSYILGFILADGSIQCRDYKESKYSGYGYNIVINLHLKDIEILNFIKNEICPNNKIYIYKKIGSDNIYREQCKLSISSKELVYKIINLGIFPSKTGKETLPNIEEKYYPDLLRGFFDGDGSIYVGKQKGLN